jgi:sugar phosphate isomerase/epimerase
MKLALSNFAWDSIDNESTFKELQNIGITHIEGVLTKISNWDELSVEKLIEFKSLMDKYGLTMDSIQSIFYNVNCSSLTDRSPVLEHYAKLIECCKILGVKVMVLGSPSLRKNIDGWKEDMISILSELDGILNNTGIQLSIEPNMKGYGGGYFYTVNEIVDLIGSNGFKNIKTMIDTHNVKLEDLDPLNEFKKHIDYINHIHISEPGLKPLSDFNFHKEFSQLLRASNYNGVVTYEVMKCENLMGSVSEFYDLYK